jgi:hypothetical protein
MLLTSTTIAAMLMKKLPSYGALPQCHRQRDARDDSQAIEAAKR